MQARYLFIRVGMLRTNASEVSVYKGGNVTNDCKRDQQERAILICGPEALAGVEI